MSKENVTTNRHKYIGGSDIPIIMGLSPFKTRFELLQEKSQRTKNEFQGNRYTEYGDTLEPLLRNYVSIMEAQTFEEDSIITKVDKNLGHRCNVDGISEDTILEIKTTSKVGENIDFYKTYLVQLLFYMNELDYKNGVLCVYERPGDFDENLNTDNIQIFHITKDEYQDTIQEIYKALDEFKADLKRIKKQPELTANDFIPKEIISTAKKSEKIKQESEAVNEKLEKLKGEMYELMKANNISNLKTDLGTAYTYIGDTPNVIKRVIDEEKLKEDGIYEKYLIDKEIKGKRGYLKIIGVKNGI